MRYVRRGYLWLLNGMALLAAIMLVWLMVAVVLSVVIRNLGLQPSAWFFLSTEYAMFYLTLLGAPWLVRQRGHVHIELLTSILPPPVLNVLSRAVALLCVLVSLVLAWKGLDLFMMNIERSDYDVRAYFVPKWILTIVFPVSFTLMAVEFGRFVVGREILHSGEAGIKE
ncbi:MULTISPECIES: TRAP transporter small permease [unclassified Halomonas]|uniref:TRAP transporter small permease n=1 Tax=unclassified Halomonas TaxID=2609666 RepID=UPI00209D75CE|nr:MULTISPECIES: TRAP transporter small permease [unclassified Halomonas]MCP1312952.1 TRAP transporter small permease [Halomonas sp. 707D7]MCP1326505.1 TRAP transporter small permease [Halomonas sp. 707D4]